MPRPKIESQADARRLFLEEGLSPGQIAKRLGCSKSAVQKWAAAGGWVQVRREMAGSNKSIYEMALRVLRAKLEQLEQLPPEEITTSILDGITKLVKVVERARTNVKVFECAVIVGEELIGFVRREVPDEATRGAVFGVWERFLDHVKD